MHGFNLLHRNWKDNLSSLLGATEQELLISSPFVSREGVDFVIDHLSKRSRSGIRLNFVTNLSPLNISQGVTDPEALRLLAERIAKTTIIHLPRLHAKVYIADRKRAIITSGNLTAGGLSRNYEYGILATDPTIVADVRNDLEGLGTIGANVSFEQLVAYCAVAERIQRAFRNQLASVRTNLRREFARDLKIAEDELIRLRLHGSSPTKIFENTILYLLRTHGPLRTSELQPQVQTLHPDLCDDTVDRVIDGQHFGKRWKHMVRAAQSHLKERDLVEIAHGKWQLKQMSKSVNGIRRA